MPLHQQARQGLVKRDAKMGLRLVRWIHTYTGEESFLKRLRIQRLGCNYSLLLSMVSKRRMEPQGNTS